MIEHVSVPVSDYEKAKAFYGKALEPLGYTLHMDMPQHKAAGFMEGGHTSFWIVQKDNPQGIHIALAAKGDNEVVAFYDAALDAGASDNGAPGYRKDYGPGYYAAYILDEDGNNVEAVWFNPSAAA